MLSTVTQSGSVLSAQLLTVTHSGLALNLVATAVPLAELSVLLGVWGYRLACPGIEIFPFEEPELWSF